MNHICRIVHYRQHLSLAISPSDSHIPLVSSIPSYRSIWKYLDRSNTAARRSVELWDKKRGKEVREQKKGKETKKNGVFVVPGLGRLVKAHRKARVGRNPQTGEPIQIKAKTVVKFRVAKAAKDAIAPKK